MLSSIYYLLSHCSPVGYLHRNRSDIMHYFHMGQSIEYLLLGADGKLQRVTMGHDLDSGQRLQLCVPANVWKASRLLGGDFGLISEAVSPGFDYDDMEMADQRLLADLSPELRGQLAPYVKPGWTSHEKS